MPKQKPLEVITPPNMLKVKVGGKVGFDSRAVERAEAALKSMSVQFEDWLGREVDALRDAWNVAKKEGLQSTAGENVYSCAHDLKGLGVTYGYPIISRMGGSLSRLLETHELRGVVPEHLVEAHVAAIRAAVRDKVTDVDHPVGRALVTELEDRVEEIFPNAA